MSYHGPILVQNISKTTKRIKVDVEAYLTPESNMRTGFDEMLQDALADLQKESHCRLYNYVKIAKDYTSVGDMCQVALHNKADCKRYLFQSAASHWIACRYFNPEGQMNRLHNWFYVDFCSKEFFENAIIADADDLARKLGEYLLTIERHDISYAVWEAYRATNLLYFGRDKEAGQACATARSKLKSKAILLMADVYEALLEGDNQRFYDALIASMRLNRRDPNLIDWLDTWAISMGKIAVKRGFEVPIDTEDCPQCLIQPEQCDYSHIEIPAPIEGFPWEQGRQ